MKQKNKFLIIVISEFVLIVAVLLLIFLAGKKVYTITFDINGGTLLSGDLVQKVTQGQNATPPIITKDGCYFRSWEGKYTKVTKDATVKAIWEYDTTEGIVYNVIPDSNYCTIKSCYKQTYGDVYIGAFYNNLKVLGIEDEAFKDCKYIENIYLLDGLINIGDSAFEGCTSLKSITIPSTVRRIGDNAFKNCSSLESVTLNENLLAIGEYAFSGCSALKEILIPVTVKEIGKVAFDTDEMLINVYLQEDEIPSGWSLDWFVGSIDVTYGYEIPVDEEEEEELDKEKGR